MKFNGMEWIADHSSNNSEESRTKDLGLVSEGRRIGNHGLVQLESTGLSPLNKTPIPTESSECFRDFLWYF